MDKSKRFSLMAPKTPSDDGSFHHRRVASADAEPNGSFGSTLDRDSRNAPSGELQPLLSLVSAHSKKTYFSGYLAARTVRLENGKPTKPGDSRSELQGVFVKLIGTVLNVWVRRDMEAAAAQGSAVPPKYINIADGYAEIIGSILVSVPPPEYQRTVDHVFSLNYAGLNKQEYVAPDQKTLNACVHAIRLASWEKKRLEELYTGHLLRILQKSNLPGNSGRQPFIEPRSPLVKGKLEGWVKVRFVGTAKWQKLFLVLTNYRPSERKRSFFGGNSSSNIVNTTSSNSSLASHTSFPTPPQPAAIASFYSQKNPKSSTKPVYTLTLATQAFAIFPERVELIGHSGLLKVEGILQNTSDDSAIASIAGLREDGWCLIMPELDEKTPATSAWAEMLKWLVGIHDAFGLYGRPRAYSWDPRDPKSLFFSYPIGPQKHKLFLDAELAQTTDVNETRSWAIRANLLGILRERMLPPSTQARLKSSASRPSSTTLSSVGSRDGMSRGMTGSNGSLNGGLSASLSGRPLSLQPGAPSQLPLRQPPSISSSINRSPLLGSRNPSGISNLSNNYLPETTEEVVGENDTVNNSNFSSPSLPPINEAHKHPGSSNDRTPTPNEPVKETDSTSPEHVASDMVYNSTNDGSTINKQGYFDNPPTYSSQPLETPSDVRSSPPVSSINTPGSFATGSVEEQTARAAQELRQKLSLGNAQIQEKSNRSSRYEDEHIVPYPDTPQSENVEGGSVASKYSQNTYNETSEEGPSEAYTEALGAHPEVDVDDERTPHVPVRQPPTSIPASMQPISPAESIPTRRSMQPVSPAEPNPARRSIQPVSPAETNSVRNSMPPISPLDAHPARDSMSQVSRSPGSPYQQGYQSPPRISSPPMPPIQGMPGMPPMQPMQPIPGMPPMPGMPPIDPNVMGNQAAFFQAMMAAQQAFQQAMWQYSQNPQGMQGPPPMQAMPGVPGMPGNPSNVQNAHQQQRNQNIPNPTSPSQYSQMSPNSAYSQMSPVGQTSPQFPTQPSYQSFYAQQSPRNDDI